MPYRRLPNSDSSRLAALNAAWDKAGSPARADLAFSAASYAKLTTLRVDFANALTERGGALSSQGADSAALESALNIARQCVSHFFQTLNNAIKRHTQFTEADRAYYGLPMGDEKLPALTAESDILRWGDAITSGETARMAAHPTGKAMDLPSAAEVGAAIAGLRAASKAQSDMVDEFDAKRDAVAAMRAEVDALILDIWDEVEFTYRRQGSPAAIRHKAREYGVVYDTKPGEAPDPDPDAPTPPPPAPPTP